MITKISKTYMIGNIDFNPNYPKNNCGVHKQTSGIAIRFMPYFAERGQNQFAISWNKKVKRLNLPFVSIWFY